MNTKYEDWDVQTERQQGETWLSLKVVKPDDAAKAPAAPPQMQVRQVVIETDGRAINLVRNQLSVLELHEVGRQLMAL